MRPHRLNFVCLLTISVGLLSFACQKRQPSTVKTTDDLALDHPEGRNQKSQGVGRKTPVAPPREALAKMEDESYQCPRLVFERATGQPIVKMDQFVDLRLEKGQIFTRIHISEASTDLSFEQCRILPADGSEFSTLFVIECSTFQGLDGAPFSIDAFLVKGYAGISPVLDASYPKYPSLVEVGKRTGRGTPRRTIVLYVEKKQMMEFLCYP